MGWIGYDLDRTLAFYDRKVAAQGPLAIGAPIPAMVARLREDLAAGKDVRIFTARVSENDPKVIGAIHRWCQTQFGRVLPVTNVKDREMDKLYDDKAVGVVPNTGELVGGDRDSGTIH